MATTAEVRRLVYRLMGDASSYERMLKKVQLSTKAVKASIQTTTAQVKKFAAQLDSYGKAMRRMGRTMSLAVTAPLAAVGAFSVRAFSQFDQAMTESTSIMKVTQGQTDQMRKTAIKLGTDGRVKQGPKELAEAYFFLASAGKNAEQSMALLPAVATFATAGAFDMAKATDLLTDAQSALGMTSKDVAQDQKNLIEIGDQLVKANTLANASVEQFATALTTKAGSALKAWGIELNEGMALLAAYADQGVKAELAGNAVDRMLRLLTKAVAENADEFERLGVKVFQGGEFRKFSDIIRDIEKATRGMKAEVKAATLKTLGFEARVAQVILPLLGTSDALEKYSEKLKQAGGATKEVAERQMKSFANQMKVFQNQLQAVAIDIGERLIPVVEALTGFVREGIKMWKGFSGATKTVVLSIAGVTAAVGPLLLALGTMLSVLGLAAKGLLAFKASIILTRGAMAGLIGLGIAAFFIGIKMAVAGVNERLQETIRSLHILGARRLQFIASIEDPKRRAEEVSRERKRRLKDVQLARNELRRQIEATTGEGFIRAYKRDPKGIDYKGLSENLISQIQPFRDNLAAAQRDLERFEDFQRTMVEEAKFATQQRETEAAIEEANKALLRREEIEKRTAAAREAAFRNEMKLQNALQAGVSKYIAGIQSQIDLGQRVIDQFLSPEEKLAKAKVQLDLLKKHDFLGIGEIGEENYRRAMKQAMEEFDEAKKEEVGKVAVTPRIRAVATNSLEAVAQRREYLELRSGMEKAGPTKAEDFLREIEKNTAALVNKPDLTDITETSMEGP